MRMRGIAGLTLSALWALVGAGCAESPVSRDAGGGAHDIGPPSTDARIDSGGQDDASTDAMDPDKPWAVILEPADGAAVDNPVTFVISANKVFAVRIFVDQWPLGPAWDPLQSDQLTYTFNGVGYQRQVELFGYDAQGDTIASHSIQITVSPGNQDKGQLVGQMWNTYYYLASETDYAGAADTDLYDASCKVIATVAAKYSDAVCIEGSGLLKDGRVINYEKTCSCGRPCPTGGIVCYSVLDKAKYPWGMGAQLNPLVPLRSWAVDKTVIPIGTVLYAEQWDGVKLPSVSGLGGFTHDGCFRADDVGGGITGMQHDFFAGTRSMWLALEKVFATKSTFTVYKNPGRCSHLAP
jgi:3D (Asp-Asp-Asp) domain-containing protein